MAMTSLVPIKFWEGLFFNFITPLPKNVFSFDRSAFKLPDEFSCLRKYVTESLVISQSNNGYYIKKSISMSKGLKVSSLECNCIFYRPDHNAKEGPNGIEFWMS